MMNIEELVKEYVKNKASYKINVVENIRYLTDDLVNNNFSFDVDIKDLILPHKIQKTKEKNNNISDQTAETLVRYEQLKKNFIERQTKLVNEKLDHLYYLTSIKDLFDQIDFHIIKLSPKEKVSIDIYAQGGKIDQIANELECSYNTARNLLQKTFESIIGDVSKKMEQNGINCHQL